MGTQPFTIIYKIIFLWVAERSKWVCTIESGSVRSQSGSVYYRKWVCNKSKWVCTVKSGSVKSQSGSAQYKRRKWVCDL